MTYLETLDFLYAQLPMFQRVGAQAYKPSLDNTIALLDSLGNPQHQFKSIHVAGTNGKGSSSHMLASVLQTAGFKTGLYTSPHLKDFRERIKINGDMISESYVVSFVERVKDTIHKINPSFFELCVAMSFDYFAYSKVDIAVIEVGMGGRLDSTNVIIPECCLITNISYDHMQFLGDTLEKIAGEKAGIIKKNIPVVVSQTQVACKHVFEQKASENNAPLYFADEQLKVSQLDSELSNYSKFKVDGSNLDITELKCSLTGHYQEKNIRGVLICLEILIEKGINIETSAIQEGIKDVKKKTGLRGRWDCLGEMPTIIADTGHNEDGILQIIHQLDRIHFENLHWVWGMVNDKDPEKIFKLLPKTANYYFCKPNIPRGLDAETCKNKANAFGLRGNSYDSVALAFEAAKQNAKKTDLILVGGSTFVVAEVL